MTTFEIVGDEFHLDGAPHQVIAGAIHYFRVPREYWTDRIRKAKQMGLNAIETYVAWNLHEPVRGEWRTDGDLDLGAFIDAVHAEGMHMIVRPGPYICAEFDNGGLPHWLTDAGRTPLRCSDPRFLEPTLGFLDRVYDIVAPRQVSLGGPVILVQIENEYGAYGRDLDYLRALTDATRDAGITVPLTTVDQPRPEDLPHGTLPELLATGSFGSRAPERLAYLREVQPTGPLMCSEFWCGWFDSDLEYHHTTPAQASADALEDILAAGASVSIYMFHGGTNFALTNGANDKGLYRPIVTSYDYDAPLSEAGHPTDKYWAFRDVIARHAPVPDDAPAEATEAPTPAATITGTAPLSRIASADGAGWVQTDHAPTFDELGAYRGFLLHESEVEVDTDACAVLRAENVRDRVVAFADQVRVGTIERTLGQNTLSLPAGRYTLRLLVEDMGHVDYGCRLGEAKGLIGPVTVNGAELTGWRTLAIDPTEAAALHALLPAARTAQDSVMLGAPSLVRATFDVEEPTDLFLDLSGWGRGLTWVNGRLLGRHWQAGPTGTLYVPGPWLHAGDNEIVVLETEPVADAQLRFVPSAQLGPIDW